MQRVIGIVLIVALALLAQTPVPSPFIGGSNASGSVTSVGLAGTANQITVTGSTPITSAGSWTLSIPTSPTLPGTTTGTFSGNLTGNVTGNVTGNLTGAVTGNASTATALAANPTNCSAGNYPLGIDASGNVNNCTAAPAAGGLVLVEQHTASSSAALNFTTCISSTYDEYEINVINVLPATNSVTLNMQVSTDGGSTYVTGANYEYARNFNSTTSGGPGSSNDAAATGIPWWLGDLSNTATLGLSGTGRFFNPGSSTALKSIIYSIFGTSAAGARYYMAYAGAYTANTAVNAFRFIASSGNLASGTVRCYGVSK